MSPPKTWRVRNLVLLNKNDNAHAKCKAIAAKLTGKLVTTEWVFLEVADGLASSRHRSAFATVREAMRRNKDLMIIPFDMSLYGSAIATYASHRDKQWSLTDCTSFAVMRQQDISEALTGDEHFEQAGFVALLK